MDRGAWRGVVHGDTAEQLSASINSSFVRQVITVPALFSKRLETYPSSSWIWCPLTLGKSVPFGASVFSSLKWDDYNYHRVVLTTDLGQAYNHTELDTEKLRSN